MGTLERWDAFCRDYWWDTGLQVGLDLRRMELTEDFREQMKVPMKRAFAEMKQLEQGGIVNADEGRMVGHYWLRNAALAPEEGLRQSIENARTQIRAFVDDVHAGRQKPPNAERFTHFILVGIGGSALGPQLVADALRGEGDAMKALFVDNTDPDGLDRLLQTPGLRLEETLVLVISKSGGTKETRNGMLELKAAYERQELDFSQHAVVVTGEGSPLEALAQETLMRAIFPMWDWVGGRTSLCSAVGLLPAALQGVDIDALLQGAHDMDLCTRRETLEDNPAALLALSWYHATEGRGVRDMVVLPYKDRLLLLSRYLQQLVMESLGKELDREGCVVRQGIVVYGNKGSTDQHAFVQQLREGPDNFFVNFIQVRKERQGPLFEVEENVTGGDYLLGFLYGTREALSQKGHRSLTLSLPEINAHSLGMLIALYERAVGLYASLVNINAYHQPGVEAGKRAATNFLTLQHRVLAALQEAPTSRFNVPALAQQLDAHAQSEAIFYILEQLAANKRIQCQGDDPRQRTYSAETPE